MSYPLQPEYEHSRLKHSDCRKALLSEKKVMFIKMLQKFCEFSTFLTWDLISCFYSNLLSLKILYFKENLDTLFVNYDNFINN